jgi:hypothetical protein
MKDLLIVLRSSEVKGEILKQRPFLQGLSAFEDFYSFLYSGVLFVDAEGVEFDFSLNINIGGTRTGLS